MSSDLTEVSVNFQTSKLMKDYLTKCCDKQQSQFDKEGYLYEVSLSDIIRNIIFKEMRKDEKQ